MIRREAGLTRELIGRQLSLVVPGRATETVQLPDADFLGTLRDTFGLDFTPEEQAALTARLTPLQPQ